MTVLKLVALAVGIIYVVDYIRQRIRARRRRQIIRRRLDLR